MSEEIEELNRHTDIPTNKTTSTKKIRKHIQMRRSKQKKRKGKRRKGKGRKGKGFF